MAGEARLRGQVAIVTGGSGGIGWATCLALLAAEASVTVVDVIEERVQAVTAGACAHLGAATGDRTLGLVLDVRREEDMARMAEATVARFGRIDLLVAAAGILRARGAPPRLVAQTTPEEWDEVLDTNLRGVFLANRAVLPAMLRQHAGQIVNVASVQGRQGHAYDAAYCASKAGVIGLSESLAEEVRAEGVRVHVVLPDAVETPMWEQNGPIPRPPAMLPAGRVAEFILYLLTLPEDTVLISPVIAPFQRRRRGGAARPLPQTDQEGTTR